MHPCFPVRNENTAIFLKPLKKGFPLIRGNNREGLGVGMLAGLYLLATGAGAVHLRASLLLDAGRFGSGDLDGGGLRHNFLRALKRGSLF